MMCEHQWAITKAGEMVCINCRENILDILAAANARIAELTAERQRDALDGQAALDEANSRITSYEQQFGEYCKGAKSDVDYWKKRAEQAEENLAWVLQNYCDECDYDQEICRGTQPDVRCVVRVMDDSEGAAIIEQNRRMREAIVRYASAHVELLSALKDAVEGKS